MGIDAIVEYIPAPSDKYVWTVYDPGYCAVP